MALLVPLAACGGTPAGNGTETAAVETPTPSPTPTPAGRIADEAGLLSATQRVELSARLGSLELRTGRKVVIATVKSLHGRDIDEAVEILGTRLGVHDGVILLVAVKEREVRLAVGRGSDRLLTTAEAKQIVNGAMYPDLHANRFGAGILKGANRIIAELSETMT
ncbi:MAG: TPM domain-containing protein [Sphingomonas sp.]